MDGGRPTSAHAEPPRLRRISWRGVSLGTPRSKISLPQRKLSRTQIVCNSPDCARRSRTLTARRTNTVSEGFGWECLTPYAIGGLLVSASGIDEEKTAGEMG